MLNDNNKNTRTTWVTSGVFIVNFGHNITSFSKYFFVNLEQVNVSWVANQQHFLYLTELHKSFNVSCMRKMVVKYRTPISIVRCIQTEKIKIQLYLTLVPRLSFL